ncbi:putative translin-associated factor X-interacting protein 1-like [Penaeus vannamei]|uniref:Putative translin-associated factor X-interacting protein 1-like n=1 Tax=Penaeus vannamei TaxID=6689 RepID=A0A3R7NY84_PENVA|nr:putative translin-associated factor X-interacting protein 1-like [Penaeus vannamei]
MSDVQDKEAGGGEGEKQRLGRSGFAKKAVASEGEKQRLSRSQFAKVSVGHRSRRQMTWRRDLAAEETARSRLSDGERCKPRPVLRLEDRLRHALVTTFCLRGKSGPPFNNACDEPHEESAEEDVQRVVEETLAQLVQMVRPHHDLLALLHHGYHHLLSRLHARIKRLMLRESMAGHGTCGGRDGKSCLDLRIHHQDLQQRQQELLQEVASLRHDLAKAEADLTKELRRAEDAKDEKNKMEILLLEARVEAGGLRRKLEKYTQEGEAASPQLLAIALKKCREEVSARGRRVEEMERQYREVVPRADFERQQRRLASLTATHQQLALVHDMLKEQHETLLNVHEVAVKERDSLSEENQSLRRAATPRPDWNRVAEYVEGGISRWRELSYGRTSDQTVDILISELTGSQLPTSTEFIDCKGTEASVPAYLRYEGSVRNRRLGKRDLMHLIDDIWREKRKSSNKAPMDVFVDKYFRERYHLEDVRAEWCYSLADACQRLAHEEQIGLFWGILCGQVQEEVYHYQVDIVQSLYSALKSRDPQDLGLVSRDVVKTIIKSIFPLKSQEYVQVLMDFVGRAASLKDPNAIKYHNLFVQVRRWSVRCACLLSMSVRESAGITYGGGYVKNADRSRIAPRQSRLAEVCLGDRDRREFSRSSAVSRPGEESDEREVSRRGKDALKRTPLTRTPGVKERGTSDSKGHAKHVLTGSRLPEILVRLRHCNSRESTGRERGTEIDVRDKESRPRSKRLVPSREKRDEVRDNVNQRRPSADCEPKRHTASSKHPSRPSDSGGRSRGSGQGARNPPWWTRQCCRCTPARPWRSQGTTATGPLVSIQELKWMSWAHRLPWTSPWTELQSGLPPNWWILESEQRNPTLLEWVWSTRPRATAVSTSPAAPPPIPCPAPLAARLLPERGHIVESLGARTINACIPFYSRTRHCMLYSKVTTATSGFLFVELLL